MAGLSGWLAVSTQAAIYSSDPFIQPGAATGGVAISPVMEEQPRLIAWPKVLPGHLIRYLAILDDPVAGYVLAYWKSLPEYTETPADLPPTTIRITFSKRTSCTRLTARVYMAERVSV